MDILLEFCYYHAMITAASIRRSFPGEVLDYQQLQYSLRGYAKPRDKITALLRSGDIIRVKKGLYVFGENYRRGPWSREILANLIYGPSYISLDYALSYYGLIPEEVTHVTSVTSAATRRFETPLGVFTYRQLAQRKYTVGIDQRVTARNSYFLIATPAKALADKVWTDTRASSASISDLESYLHEDLRIDPDDLARVNLANMGQIAEQYGSRKVRFLQKYIEEKR